MRKEKGYENKTARVSVLFSVLIGLWLAQGCGGGNGGQSTPSPVITPKGDIQILEPHQGQTVQGHSTHFSVTLGSDLDPSQLHVLLNLKDMNSHLKVSGSQAEGNVSGMQEGENVLTFTAPGLQGGSKTSEVRFSFTPKPVDSVEMTETLSLPGLNGIVEVLVDSWGVHHIYTMGNNPMDLWYVQGYMEARHRLFQIDFFRKVAQGRLAELLGTALDRSVLETDLYYRTLFLTYEGGQVGHIDEALAQDIETNSPELYAYLSRFVQGVNAYIDDLTQGRNGTAMPQQYQLLSSPLFGLGSYTIEPMTVAQILAIGRLQQFDLSQTLYEEIDRKVRWESLRDAEQLGTIPAGSLEDIFRAEPPDHTTILKPGEPGYSGPTSDQKMLSLPRGPSTWSPGSSDKGQYEYLKKTLERMNRIRRRVWGQSEKPFSNNWILSPSMTSSGFAMLCNDPHLSLTNPSIFYPIHCDNKSFSGGSMNFSGSTFPGIPGILLGQNERMAWGGTVTNYDVMDIYEESVQSSGGTKSVAFNGHAVPVVTIHETFKIRGGDPELGAETEIPIDYVPHHGPQVPGDPFAPDPTLTAHNNLTVRWTGHFITRDLQAFFGLLDAQGINDFHSALENFGVGAQNFVGADVNGEIAYFPMALIPLRTQAALTPEHPPYLPLPGTGGYEWIEDTSGRPQFVPTDQVPQIRNPSRGWVVTANNDITGETVDNDALNDPLYLYYSINVGFRNGRISDRLLSLEKGQRDPAHMKEIQGDHLSPFAQRVRPFFSAALSNSAVLSTLSPDVRARVEAAKALVEGWDLRCETGMPDPFTGAPPSEADVQSSLASSVFFVWLNRLTEAVFDDELSKAGTSVDQDDRARALLHILEHVNEPAGSPYQVHTLGPDGQSLLWDNINTPDQIETRDEIMVQAMVQALDDLPAVMKSPATSAWQWGKVHTLTFQLQGIGSAVDAFNLPSYSILTQICGGTKGYPRAGGYQTVDPANYELNGLDFTSDEGPAMRMVVELEDGVMTAYNVLPGGVNDLYPTANILKPVQVNQDIHYGDQIPLWLANQYRSQFVFWEDVTQVAESRIQFEPVQ